MDDVSKNGLPATGRARIQHPPIAGLFQHGLPDAPHKWSLAGRDKKAEAAEREFLRRCPECGAIIPLSTWHCTECGTVLREPASERREIETRLVPAERLRTMTYRQVLQRAGRDEARLRLVARAWLQARLGMASPE